MVWRSTPPLKLVVIIIFKKVKVTSQQKRKHQERSWIALCSTTPISLISLLRSWRCRRVVSSLSQATLTSQRPKAFSRPSEFSIRALATCWRKQGTVSCRWLRRRLTSRALLKYYPVRGNSNQCHSSVLKSTTTGVEVQWSHQEQTSLADGRDSKKSTSLKSG